jgi:hypothetical protein
MRRRRRLQLWRRVPCNAAGEAAAGTATTEGDAGDRAAATHRTPELLPHLALVDDENTTRLCHGDETVVARPPVIVHDLETQTEKS